MSDVQVARNLAMVGQGQEALQRGLGNPNEDYIEAQRRHIDQQVRAQSVDMAVRSGVAPQELLTQAREIYEFIIGD
ncbi:MAG TPA: hypothetical protein VGA17_11515 [Nitrospiraceae bacterium]